MECSLEDVIDTLRHNKTTLLIGSGCSTNGGIPNPESFVKIIKQQYPHAYSQAAIKNYHHCIAALTQKQRNQLISRQIEQSKVNWAHIGIAQLIKNGYVERVLTTSFDPLLVRACAIVGIFPAIYDLSIKQDIDINTLATPAIFYLHGQKEACIKLDTEAQYEKYLNNFAPIFTNAGEKESWIVAGYDGTSDPVFSLLAEVNIFKNNLYWVAHESVRPPRYVNDELINTKKNAFTIKGYNSDEFFTELTKGLDCFPPSFVKHPFSNIDNDIEPEPQTPQTKTPTIPTTSEQTLICNTHEDLKQGLYDKVIATQKMYSAAPPQALRIITSWAHTIKADKIIYKMKNSSLSDSRKKLSLAGNEYRKALELNPRMHAALNNWGIAITRYAKQLENKEANIFFILAYEKYHSALKIYPDKYTTLNNWGSALSEQAQLSNGKVSKRLFQMANSKFQAALKIKSDAEEVSYNWANSLFEQAKKTEANKRSIELYQQASEKYQQALKVMPNNSDVLCNWALSFLFQAHRVSKEETADTLYERANAIYRIVLEISPDDYQSLDKCNILNQWGITLMSQAKTKSLKTKDKLLKKAHEKLILAESIQQGSAAYNLVCLYAIQNNKHECYQWLKKLDKENLLPNIEELKNDDDLIHITEAEWLQNLPKLKENKLHEVTA